MSISTGPTTRFQQPQRTYPTPMSISTGNTMRFQQPQQNYQSRLFNINVDNENDDEATHSGYYYDNQSNENVEESDQSLSNENFSVMP